MKVAFSIVVGVILLYSGVGSLPDLVAVFRKADGPYFLGQALFVAAELGIGLWLFVYGVRASRKQRGDANPGRKDV